MKTNSIAIRALKIEYEKDRQLNTLRQSRYFQLLKPLEHRKFGSIYSRKSNEISEQI